jgi:LytS/YehU family sensor histidine kinase
MRAGHGLENLEARLHARYGAAATLDIAQREDGARVTLSLPAAPRPVTV